VAIATMLDFASRHNVAPQTEHFPMSNINEAFARLESGKAVTASCWTRISDPDQRDFSSDKTFWR
jgi:D-arabinose 1-dehydrogenase-like Zn-dependent alcohol dehydrogenase